MTILPYLIEERITTATGVEKPIATEPVGTDRDQALKLFAERVAANLPAYAPATGIRLVLKGGGQ